MNYEYEYVNLPKNTNQTDKTHVTSCPHCKEFLLVNIVLNYTSTENSAFWFEDKITCGRCGSESHITVNFDPIFQATLIESHF